MVKNGSKICLIFSGLIPGPLSAKFYVQFAVTAYLCADLNPATMTDCIDGIVYQVEKHLLQLRAVGHGHREVFCQILDNSYIVIAGLSIDKGDSFLEEIVDLHLFLLTGHLPGKTKQSWVMVPALRTWCLICSTAF